MSSRYQSATTRGGYNSTNENRLDELLEDLQSTVNRPQMNGSASPKPQLMNGNLIPRGHMNGGPRTTTTGYREVMKSVKKEETGKPVESSKEYHIEYLNPSNTTTVIKEERSASPSFFNTSSSLNDTSTGSGLKTVSYEYNKSRSEKSQSSQSSQPSKFDTTFRDPIETSTPQKKIERMEQRTYEEQRYGTVNPSPPIRTQEIKKEVIYDSEPSTISRFENNRTGSTKDLVFTGSSGLSTTSTSRFREPSPAKQIQQEVYRYEAKTTSTRKNVVSPDFVDHASPIESQITYRSTPSPASSSNTYNYIRETTSRRSPSPVRSLYTPPSPAPAAKTTYSSVIQSSRQQETNRREVSKSPTSPPYRSPSPVTFTHPPESPEPAMKTYSFEKTVKTHSSASPQPVQKFSPSDPSSREFYPQPQPTPIVTGGRSVIEKNYKYSSQQHTTERYPGYENGYKPEERTIPIQRQHYPSPSPVRSIPVEQTPPKQLDELMATFSETEMRRETSTNRYGGRSPAFSKTGKSPTPDPTIETTLKPIPIEELPQKEMKFEKSEKANGVAGPPVYYPPGPLFTKTEESGMMMEQSSGGKGKMKANRKAKYKYEAGSKMKESSGTKKTVVPLCLPMCCALPCVIM